MDFPLLPFIKSSKKVKRFEGAEKSIASFSNDISSSQKKTKVWRGASNGIQDLPPPSHLLKKRSNSGGLKRSREISGIEQHLAQLKRKQNEIDTSDISEISSVNVQLSENSSPQEVPSSPVLKRARNSFTDINSPFYTEVADCNYQVFIDHVWDEEGPVDITVPKVTVKRMRKPNLPFIGATSKQQKETFEFLQLRPGASQTEMNPSRQCDNDPCSTNTILNILPHEE